MREATIEEKLAWFHAEANARGFDGDPEAFRECLAMLKKAIEQRDALMDFDDNLSAWEVYNAELLKAAEGKT
ncbi:MAG: hypothetical protein KF767_08780 [Bdellovibrionaceae bacterium]|nr:hypothetical protein [Pseudobdellovibrionaceae bacterium]